MYPSPRRPFLYLWSVATVLALTAPASPQGPGRCTSDALTIDGQHIGATFCVVDQRASGSNAPVRVTISQALSSPSGSLKRSTTLDFVASDPARAIDDIPLGALGIKKTLHSTFLYTGGAVKLERAMLVPGAVTVR